MNNNGSIPMAMCREANSSISTAEHQHQHKHHTMSSSSLPTIKKNSTSSSTSSDTDSTRIRNMVNVLRSSITRITRLQPMSASTSPPIPTHKIKNNVKIISALLTFVFFASSLTETDQYQFTGSRFLGEDNGPVKKDQIFQMTLTGVPNRVPALVENFFFEEVLSNYLEEKLAPKGIKTYGVRVTRDKTMHYQRLRSLNNDEQARQEGREFTVAGERFNSNGEMEIDQETMNRIEDVNQRVLGSGGDGANMHQLSLLVSIKGIYYSSTNIDFNSLVMSTINEGQVELVQRLLNNNGGKDKYVGDGDPDYFKNLQFLVVVGVGPRDPEPVLHMATNNGVRGITGNSRSRSNMPQEKDVPTTSIFDNLNMDNNEEGVTPTGTGTGTNEDADVQQSRSENKQNFSSRTNTPQESDVPTTSIFDKLKTDNTEDGLTPTDTNEDIDVYKSRSESRQNVNNEKSSLAKSVNGLDSNTNTNSFTYNPLKTSKVSNDDDTQTQTNVKNNQMAYDSDNNVEKKPTIDNLKSHSGNVFNAQAIEFRLVSGLVFSVLCAVIGLMHVGRVAAKKHEERKKRLILAKKAYDGPRSKHPKGKQQPFFNNTRKYLGTMDTGAGL